MSEVFPATLVASGRDDIDAGIEGLNVNTAESRNVGAAVRDAIAIMKSDSGEKILYIISSVNSASIYATEIDLAHDIIKDEIKLLAVEAGPASMPKSLRDLTDLTDGQHTYTELYGGPKYFDPINEKVVTILKSPVVVDRSEVIYDKVIHFD